MEHLSKKQSIGRFMITLLIICFGLFITYYAQNVGRYNTTILAFNYSYGFISRGLLGTLYLLLNNILPYDILNFESVVNITLIATSIVMITFFILSYCILRKCKTSYLTNIEYVIIYFAMFFVSMYYSTRNLGRPDIYMMFLTFIGLLCIIHEKFEWLIIPLSITCVMIHQGYVFLFYNIFMYPLIYQIFRTTGKKRNKYLWILGISFLSVSILFLYFNFFSHISGEETAAAIKELATELGPEGDVYETLITHEILGIDPWNEEWPQHIYNFIELPIFCLFMLPYIILGVRLFRNIIKSATSMADKILYALLPICSCTILPMYILKIDYGRWIYAGVAYFSLVVLVLCAWKDEIVTEQLHLLMEYLQSRYAYASLLLIYISTIVPLYDIHINQILRVIADYLDVNWLHILG